MRASADFVMRRIAGETIMVPVGGEVGDLNSVYTLNESGTMIFQMICAGMPFEQISDAICTEYDVSPEEAGRDIADFMDRLRASSILDSSQ